MKLYYAPGACSLAVHIALRESGVSFELERVDLRTKKTERGADYLAINPKGYVPALGLDEGGVLTEASACLQYVGDRRPEAQLAPPCGSLPRYRLVEWLGFIATELHKQFAPFWHRGSDEVRHASGLRIAARLAYIDERLDGQPHLLGEAFTVADAYLYVMTTWAQRFEIDLAQWPNVSSFAERVAQRPSVVEARLVEGLDKA